MHSKFYYESCIDVVEVCFERALWTAEAQWLRYFVHESNSWVVWSSLLVGWLIWSNQITTTFAWLRKPLFYCQFEKQESLFVWNIIFLREQMTDLIDVCRFESGREQIYTVMKYLLNLIWKFLLSLKGSF